ncbi:hypothetical protein [Limimaricola cinnabarinus]|uniref:hypothetical protein n=1 Tax=Limimaricola cinnabarinus TaxID=1125964 RepID=UPI002492DCB2|nr:hypothetical protein [Limimaricola cinnabarinus]
MSEADLCREFIGGLPRGWTAYPETGGFDILLSRDADGFQIGVEAKLTLNAKVICQAAEARSIWSVAASGPDCRAVLVPESKTRRNDFGKLLDLLNIVVITFQSNGNYGHIINPQLPQFDGYGPATSWPEFAPVSRISLPDYVPDVIAGDSAPVRLTDWKVKAIKIALTLEKRGWIARQDFKHFQISMSMWTQNGWIAQRPGEKVWRSKDVPDFRVQHPVNFAQIEADYEKWKAPMPEVQIPMEFAP